MAVHPPVHTMKITTSRIYARLLLRYILLHSICSTYCPTEILSFSLQYKYANYSSADYATTGNSTLKFRLINQRADFSFALFSGGLSNVRSCFFDLLQLMGFCTHMLCHFSNVSYVDSLILFPLIVMQPKLVAVSNNVTFLYPKAPLYPRLALGKLWDEVSLCYYELVPLCSFR